MCKFIEVTDIEGTRKLVNTSYIVEVLKDNDNSLLLITVNGGGESLKVRLPYESMRDILMP